MRFKIIVEETEELYGHIDVKGKVEFDFVASNKDEILDRIDVIVDKIMGENNE